MARTTQHSTTERVEQTTTSKYSESHARNNKKHDLSAQTSSASAVRGQHEYKYSPATAKPSWIPTEMYPYLPESLPPQVVHSDIPLAHPHERPAYIVPQGYAGFAQESLVQPRSPTQFTGKSVSNVYPPHGGRTSDVHSVVHNNHTHNVHNVQNMHNTGAYQGAHSLVGGQSVAHTHHSIVGGASPQSFVGGTPQSFVGGTPQSFVGSHTVNTPGRYGYTQQNSSPLAVGSQTLYSSPVANASPVSFKMNSQNTGGFTPQNVSSVTYNPTAYTPNRRVVQNSRMSTVTVNGKKSAKKENEETEAKKSKKSTTTTTTTTTVRATARDASASSRGQNDSRSTAIKSRNSSKNKKSKGSITSSSSSSSSSSSEGYAESKGGSKSESSESVEEYQVGRGPGFVPADTDEVSNWGSIPAREKYFNQRRGSHDLFADWQNPHSHGVKVVLKKDRGCC